jgi:23S rRNA maturation-related 3'-5' exoribonuclease YhaM
MSIISNNTTLSSLSFNSSSELNVIDSSIVSPTSIQKRIQSLKTRKEKEKHQKQNKTKSHLGGSKRNYNTNKSEKPNHFEDHLGGLKHHYLEYVYTKIQLCPLYPSVNLKNPFIPLWRF